MFAGGPQQQVDRHHTLPHGEEPLAAEGRLHVVHQRRDHLDVAANDSTSGVEQRVAVLGDQAGIDAAGVVEDIAVAELVALQQLHQVARHVGVRVALTAAGHRLAGGQRRLVGCRKYDGLVPRRPQGACVGEHLVGEVGEEEAATASGRTATDDGVGAGDATGSAAAKNKAPNKSKECTQRCMASA